MNSITLQSLCNLRRLVLLESNPQFDVHLRGAGGLTRSSQVSFTTGLDRSSGSAEILDTVQVSENVVIKGKDFLCRLLTAVPPVFVDLD